MHSLCTTWPHSNHVCASFSGWNCRWKEGAGQISPCCGSLHVLLFSQTCRCAHTQHCSCCEVHEHGNMLRVRPGLPRPCFFKCTISSNKEIEIDQHKQMFISEPRSHKISAHLLSASGSSAGGRSTAAPHGPLQGQAEAWRSCVRDARPCGYPTGGELTTTAAVYIDRVLIKLVDLSKFLRLYGMDCFCATMRVQRWLHARQVLVNVVAKLPPCEAVRLQRVSLCAALCPLPAYVLSVRYCPAHSSEAFLPIAPFTHPKCCS